MKIDFDIKKTVKEAFRAGNRARKKESVSDAAADMHNPLQDQIGRFREQTGIELEIMDGRPYFDGDLDLEYCTGLTSLPAGLEVDGDLDLEYCTGLTSLPAGLEVDGNLWLTRCTGLTSLPDGLKVGGGLGLRGCTGLTSLPFDLVVNTDYYIVHNGILTPFFEKLGIRVDKDGDTKASDWRKWQKVHGYLREAFKAGNRARKKEAAQDAVESVDKLQQQIDRFREQTGYKLEIRNDRPYYDDFIDLENCTDLTELPDGLTVRNYLCINGCTGLTKLPDNMTVGRDFYLNDCVNLTSLPHGLTVKGCMYLDNCNGLTSFPADLTVTGFSIYRIPESLFPFFNSIGVAVRFIGGIHTIDAEDWMDRRHMVNEAFKAGNRARKKESVHDSVSDIHEDEPVTDADVAADFLRDLNKRFRGVTKFKDDQYESTYVEFAVWDVNHQDTMWFSFWRDSPNLAAHSCMDSAVTLMIWSEAVVKGSYGHANGRYYNDIVLEREAIRENYVKMLQESGLPIDMTDVEARRKPRLRLTSDSLARLAAYVARQDELQRVAPAGETFQLKEAFRAGNRARKKESVIDTVKSVDTYFNSESIDELDSLIQTIWKSVCGDTGIDAPYMDNDHYDNEAGIWWGPLKFHLESGNIKYRICFLKTADMQAFNKAFNNAGNSDDEFGQECPAKWMFDMHVQIGNEMASVRFYRIEPYARYSNTNVVTYPVGVQQLTEAFSVLRLIHSRGIHTREHDAAWSMPGKRGNYFYACSRFSVQTWRNHILPIDDHEQLQKYLLDTARSVDEAFKAGNRARKRESVQDAVDVLQPLELYVPEDMHDTPETVLEKGSPAIELLFSRNGFGIEGKSTYTHPKEALWTVNIDGSLRKHISVAYVEREFAGWVMFLKTGFTVIKCLDITSSEWLGFLTNLTSKADLFRLYFWMNGDGGATQGMYDLKHRYYEHIKPIYGNTVNMTEFYDAILLALIDHYGIDMPDCCKFAETVTPVDMLRKTQTYTDIRKYISTLDVNNLDEAFRAGNRARKKESVQDTVQINKDLTDEDIDKIMDDVCGKYPEVAHKRNYYHAYNSEVLEIYDDKADDNVILLFSHPSESLDGISAKVLISSYRKTYRQGSSEQITKSYRTICSRLIDNINPEIILKYEDDYVFDLTPETLAAIYRYAAECNSLVAVSEAFRAGNRARKKESAQDAVDRFDGIPYPEDPEDPTLVMKCLLEITETALGRKNLADTIEIERNFLNYDSDNDIVATIDTTINGANLIVFARKFSKQRNDIAVRPFNGICIGGIMSNGDPRSIGPSDPDIQPAFMTHTTEVSFWPVSEIRCWKSLIGKYMEDIKAVVAGRDLM